MVLLPVIDDSKQVKGLEVNMVILFSSTRVPQFMFPMVE